MDSILVVKPSSLGDVVHTLPAVALLKRTWPDATLRWIVNPEWAPLLQGNPDIDEVIVFPRRELGSLSKKVRWARQMHAAYRSDLVLDFQGLLRSALIGRLCRKESLFGLSDAREGARFFYDRIARVGREHAVDRYLKLAAASGAKRDGPLVWRLPEGTRPKGLDSDEPFLLLHPFARGGNKSLSTGEVANFCEALPFPVVLAGRAEVQTGAIERLDHVLNLLNQTSLSELIWLIRHARFVVSVDSGPMHIAAALTPNLLSIHTWSDPALVGPYRPEAWVWKDRTLFQIGEMGSPGLKPLTMPDLTAVAAFLSERFAG